MVDCDSDTGNILGFIKIFVRSELFEMARTTIRHSSFLWRLVQDPPNAIDGYYHMDRDPELFKCLMNYLVENRIRNDLPCSVEELYNESLFYGIQLPENDCWGTTLSYTLSNINTYDIRGQLKSFANRHGILGLTEWRQRLSLDVEFHCHRAIDLNLVKEFMHDEEAKQKFIIRTSNQRDHRNPVSAPFQYLKTHKQDKSSTSPPHTSSSTPSSSDSCSESAKDLIKQLTAQDVKAWLGNTMFRHLAETWFTYNVDGKELLEISRKGCLRSGLLMLSGYELVRFKDVLNCFGSELELQ